MDVPEKIWIYLAMVAIIFVRWLLNQFKVASEKREAQRRSLRRSWEESSPAPSTYQPTKSNHVPPPLPPKLPSQPQTLQELFEQKRQEIAEAQRRMTSPPIVVEKSVEPVLAKTPVQNKAKQSPAIKSQPLSKRSQPLRPVRPQGAQVQVSRITKLFSSRDQMRNAIIIKEVIDKPKGFDF